MDPYGLVRQRVQTSSGRFWTWLDRRSRAIAPDSEVVIIPETETVLAVDHVVWITRSPRNWTRRLPVHRGRYGSIIVTSDRILVRSGTVTLLHAMVTCVSFQNIRIGTTNVPDGGFEMTVWDEDEQSITVISKNAESLVATIRTLQRQSATAVH